MRSVRVLIIGFVTAMLYALPAAPDPMQPTPPATSSPDTSADWR